MKQIKTDLKLIQLRVCFLVFIFFFTQQSFSQNFEWLQTYGKQTNNSIVEAIAEDKGGSAFLMAINSQIADTLHIDTINLIASSVRTILLVRLDSNGKAKRAIKLPLMGFKNHVCKDEIGNLYLGSTIKGKVQFGNVVLNSINGIMVFVKYDKNLNLEWVVQTGNDTTTMIENLKFSDGHLYFVSSTSDSTKLGNINYYSGKFLDYIFGEINTSNGNIIWSNRLMKGNNYFRLTSIIRLKRNLFLSGDFGIAGPNMTPEMKLAIGGDTLYGPGGFVIKTDTFGNYQKHFNFYNKKNLRVQDISTDGEYLYIGGDFIDSLIWGKEKISPTYKSSSPSETELYGASISYDLKPRWFYRPKVIVKGGRNAVLNISTSGGYVYFGAILAAKKIVINEDSLTTSGSFDVLLFKTDFLGNILWATNGGTSTKGWISIQSLDALAGKSVFSAGFFSGNLRLGKYSDSTTTKEQKGWITKISDYSITRGKVKGGPYCAGDTLLIPYTKFGNFDTSNIFIAQLSDEDGNFESGYRELGRLKSNKDGTIIGKLPLFQVSSSLNYRIRILSTKPAVQSYYRRDSLYLLIYSRDKADPGQPETICKGDTIKLSTYGGTKWIWSPKYRMDDSSKRAPLVWPQITTTYKIIIGDSSGCGQPDTAYKLLIVRPSLKSVLAFTDTSLCGNNTLKLPVQFKGGDSTNYQWQWYFISSPKSWFAMGKGSLKQMDTLSYNPTDSDEKLALVLSDGCTLKKDTSYVTLHLRTPVNLKTNFRDTLVCSGNKLNYIAKALGGNAKFYQWQWKDITHNTILSNSDSLYLTAKQTSRIEFTVNDGCIALGDTLEFTVIVNPPLKASILTDKGKLNDTTLCSNQNLKLFSIGKGGAGTGYNFNWYLAQTLVSTSDTFYLNTKILSLKSYLLNLVLNDNCTKDADSVKGTIKVIESPKADFSTGNTCNLKPIQFTYTGTKPAPPLTMGFLWDFAGETTSTLESPLQQLYNTGKKAIKVMVRSSNGCIDVITKNIDIKPQAKASFEVIDVCEDSPAVFINKTTVTSGKANYKWYFGDGKTSTADTPAHYYQIGGITKTFNVKLAANIPNGCSDSITQAATINANPKQGFTYTTSGQTVTFTAKETNGTNYQWTFGDGGTASTNNRQKSHTYSKFPSGKYTACLRVTNLAGCTSDSCIEIVITGGVQRLNNDIGIHIYPNPNKGNFIVDIKEPKGKVYLEIYNQVGQFLYKTELDQSINKLNFNLSNGVYMLRISNSENVYSSRIVVSH